MYKLYTIKYDTKRTKLIEAVTNVLKGYEKDGIKIIDIHGHPFISSHLPMARDDSYMDRWEKINITAHVRCAENYDNWVYETNYGITSAKLTISYDAESDMFAIDVKNIILQKI